MFLSFGFGPVCHCRADLVSCNLELAERRRHVHDARVSSRQCVIRISETHKTRAPVFGRSVKIYIWSFYVKLTVKENVKWLSHFTIKSHTPHEPRVCVLTLKRKSWVKERC